MKDAKETGGTAVIVRFMVADHNPRRATRTLQTVLEHCLQHTQDIIGTPDVLAAEAARR